MFILTGVQYMYNDVPIVPSHRLCDIYYKQWFQRQLEYCKLPLVSCGSIQLQFWMGLYMEGLIPGPEGGGGVYKQKEKRFEMSYSRGF